jgi:predicted molibdopterin-dependent oxidoreductase YjgC
MVRKRGKLQAVDWDTALQAVAKGMKGTKKLGVLASTHATNEALYLLSKLFADELKVSNVGLLTEVAPAIVDKAGSLADIEQSDMILVVGADPVNDQPVVSFFVKRAIDKGARLIVVDRKDNGLAPFAYKNLEMKQIAKAVEMAERAENPIVLYGTGVTKGAAKALKKLAKASFVAIEPGVNTRAAAAYGLNNGFDPAAAEALFVLVGEQLVDGAKVPKVKKGAFVVAQASYASSLTDRADVVLPMAIWSERAGSLTNTEGRVQKASQAVEPQGQAKAAWEILALLAAKMGKKLGSSLEEISAHAAEVWN